MSGNNAQGVQDALTALFHAAVVGRTDVVKMAFSSIQQCLEGEEENDADREEKFQEYICTGRADDGATALHIASFFNHADVVRALLNQGASLEVIGTGGDFEGKRPYECAIIAESEQTRSGNNANANQGSNTGPSTDKDTDKDADASSLSPAPLKSKGESDEKKNNGNGKEEKDRIKEKERKEKEKKEKDKYSKSASAYHVFLFEAVAMNKASMVAKLLEGGVPRSVLDGSHKNETVLHWAASFGHCETTRVLLEYGCDPNLLNSEQESALAMACKTNNVALVEMLLNEGAFSDQDTPSLLPQEPDAKLALLLERWGPGKSPYIPTHPLRQVYKLRLKEKKEKEKEKDKDRYRGRDRDRDNKSRSDDDFAFVVWEDERGSAEAPKLTDGAGGCCSVDQRIENDLLNAPTLVLWPPCQRQRSILGKPFVLRPDRIVYIAVCSDGIDIVPLLTCSGLLDTFDGFGLRAQVKKSVAGSQIQLSIDHNLCPGRHQFDISLDNDRATLVASDSTGLLYSLYCFIQLLQLHSELVPPNNNNVRRDHNHYAPEKRKGKFESSQV